MSVDPTLANIFSAIQLQIEIVGTSTQPWKVLDVQMDQCVFRGTVLIVGQLKKKG